MKRYPRITTLAALLNLKPVSLLVRLLTILSVVGVLAYGLQAQSQFLIQGTILDPSGARISGARVTVAREGGGSGPATVSNQNGEFSLVLTPGSYTVRVSADGFAESTHTFSAAEASSQPLDIVMQLSGRTDTISVSEPVGYQVDTVTTATKTATPLVNIPQSVTVITKTLIQDQAMQSMADVVRYMPGITMAQGEGNRDQLTIRGNNTTADFFVDGVRDDVQYFRDLYNIERIEALKGPNAMIFGRGGGGGIINRTTKEANWLPLHELTLRGGSFNNMRFATDLDQSIGDRVAVRLNSVFEDSDSFRDSVHLKRYGVSPSLAVKTGERSSFRAGFEHFSDDRTADRGIPSFQGKPSITERSTFFGDPDVSYADVTANVVRGTFEHQTAGGLHFRNHTLYGDYDKFYQNVFPGATNATMTTVSIPGYNNATQRRNFFNQTGATFVLTTGAVRHTLAGGTELGRQHSDNFRNTAFFNNTATTVNAPFSNPRISVPVTFRQAASDADNYATNVVAATYLQDQVELNRYFQIVAGVRYDHFSTDFHNNRNGQALSRTDGMVSPRAGVIFKPMAEASIYFNYSVSYLPSSGDQFSSLTATSQTLKPEKFNNYEVGAKWNVKRNIILTAAWYQLDRLNTTAPDPNTPGIIVQTGSQRSRGVELGINGSLTSRWEVAGGYGHLDAVITSRTSAAAVGQKVAMVPNNTLSLWNRYRLTRRFGAGLGVIHQGDSFAAIDNAVTLPSFTRADGALFVTLTEKTSLQVNVENLFNAEYFPAAHNNNNISPGSPRAVRAGMTFRF